MAIPDYQSCMLPLLRQLNDGHEHALGELIDALADEFALTPEERAQLLPSGRQSVFRNRVGWARTYLNKAGLVESSRRGVWCLTERGRTALAQAPSRIDNRFLSQWPEFVEFVQPDPNRLGTAHASEEPASPQTPQELMDEAHQSLRDQLAREVLTRVQACSPAFFEQLVVDLLVKMGYGGNRRDAGQRIGQSGDGGIDGIIKEDVLGLDTVFIQAKRWQGTVGRPEIQKFVGALHGRQAHKGVFITTSDFTAEARDYAERLGNQVVLVDGAQLARFMIDFDVGVAPAASYVVKRIDLDFFEDA